MTESGVVRSAPEDVTVLLQRLGEGDVSVANELARLVYDELHRIADRAMRHERPDHTLQPTLLVNEAFVRLIGQREARWQSRAQFYAVAARAIRRILVDHARARRRIKRDLGLRVTLDHAIAEVPERALDVLDIDEALLKLEAVASRQARVVELRYFGGLEIDAIAGALDVSPATVKRDWTFARAFLLRELGTGH